MAINQKRTGKASSMPAGLAIGAAVSIGITIIAAWILAKLLDAQTLAWQNVGYGIMILILLSSMGGAVVSIGKIKRRKLMVCMLSGLIYFIQLLSITALFFGGKYDAVGVTALLIFGGCGTIALLTLRSNRGGKRRHKTVRHR